MLLCVVLMSRGSEQHYPFVLAALGYAFDALEPSIDKATMEVHYTGHHAAYVKNLNDGLAGYPDFQGYTLKQLLTSFEKLPEAIRTTVKNNGGGHWNHTFCWRCMTPTPTKPSKRLMRALDQTFGSFQEFKKLFEQAATKVFGSGWAWLCFDPAQDKLVIVSTSNQDCPITQGLVPFLGLDVWEHAYYLKHKNKRASYISAWWDVVDWTFVEDNYKRSKSFKFACS